MVQHASTVVTSLFILHQLKYANLNITVKIIMEHWNFFPPCTKRPLYPETVWQEKLFSDWLPQMTSLP